MHTNSIGSIKSIRGMQRLFPWILIVIAWLNPIHNPPWLGFWSDTFTAIAFLLIWLLVLFQYGGIVELPKLGAIFLLLALLPWVQLAFGLLSHLGVAWVHFLYLLGFSCSFIIGWNWGKNSPGQGLDFLFSAALLASAISVGIQIIQCFFPEVAWSWLLSGVGSRFSGSLGHPNLLGTLHLWGLLAILWLGPRWNITWAVSVTVAFWLLIGIALVESRTAWVNAALILFVVHLFWKVARPRFVGPVLCAFAIFLVAMYFLVPQINAYFHTSSITYREPFDSARLDLWRVFFHAILERPWFGYGFGGGREAFIAGEVLNFSAWASHTHNLILDVAVYLGVFGAIALVVAISKLSRRFIVGFGTGDLRLIVPALALSVVLLHAMLEYPLHYAFFLLPAGLLLGSFLQMAVPGNVFLVRRPLVYGAFVLVVAATIVTVADGVKAERLFNRGEADESLSKEPGYARQFMLLDQWDDHQRFSRIPENISLTPALDEKMRSVLVTVPDANLILKYVGILEGNGKRAEAQKWLDNLCKISPLVFIEQVSLQNLREPGSQPLATLDWRLCQEKVLTNAMR